MGQKMRLDRLLANMGLGSRRDVKEAIKRGRVAVNGRCDLAADLTVDVSGDRITFDGREVAYKNAVYVVMNKPAGVVCATEDPAQKTVIDILEEPYRHMKLFPAGRLDKDTVGLLLLTNDGDFAHSMLSPKKHVYKTYYAKVSGSVGKEDVLQFREGLIISGGYKTMPARLAVIRSGGISEVEVMIREGKYHQVKKMFESVNKRVIYLKRIRIGTYSLDEDLQEGQMKEIDKEQARKMLENPPMD